MKTMLLQASLWLTLTQISCGPNHIPFTQDGDWIARSQLNGPGRSDAAGFTIGDSAYLGTGWDGLNKRYADFWQYDATSDTWSQIQSLPDAAARSSAVGFSINEQGYVGTGYDGSNYLRDFWAYDPPTNTWIRKSDFTGSARFEAVGFAIGTYGYLGTGFDGGNALKDFYRYDPLSDSWMSIGFSGSKRYAATVFVHGEKAYLVTGVNSGTAVSDFWVFDPGQSDASWQSLRPINNHSDQSYDDGYSDIVRWNAASFVIRSVQGADKAYISTGENNTAYTSTWEYDFATDLWKRKSAFEGPSTTGAVGFTVQNRGFIATGRSGPGQSAQSDLLREFRPEDVLNPNNN